MELRVNKRGEVIVPFFVVGQEEPDLQGIMDALARR